MSALPPSDPDELVGAAFDRLRADTAIVTTADGAPAVRASSSPTNGWLRLVVVTGVAVAAFAGLFTVVVGASGWSPSDELITTELASTDQTKPADEERSSSAAERVLDIGEPVDGTSWILISGGVGGQRIDVEAVPGPVTLIVGSTTVYGSDGCNDFDGTVSFYGAQLQIGPIDGDDDGCGDNGRYLDALRTVTEISFEGKGDNMVLSGVDVELVYERAGTVGEAVDARSETDPVRSVNEVLDMVPTGEFEVRGWLTRLDGGSILCGTQPSGGVVCPGRWLTLVGIDNPDAVGTLETTITGRLDDEERLIVEGTTDAELEVTVAEQAVVDALRAGDLTNSELAWHSDEVSLTLGGSVHAVVRTPAELADSAAWRLDPDAFFRARTGPFSALEALAAAETVDVSVGAHNHCAAPPMPLPAVQSVRHVAVVPTGIDSCIDWFSVDILFDDAGRVVAVNLDIWEP